MAKQDLNDLLALLDNSVSIDNGKVTVKDAARLRATIHRLAEVSALESGARQGLARFLVRQIAEKAGVVPASINDLYMARGKGKVPNNFTVPAMNLRALAFDAARAVFRAAIPIDAAAFIFEIARSEMGYTDQRPAEYVTSILAAAVAEGYQGTGVHPGRPLPGVGQALRQRQGNRAAGRARPDRRKPGSGVLQYRYRHLHAGGPGARPACPNSRC